MKKLHLSKTKLFSFLIVALILLGITGIRKNILPAQSNIIVPDYTANQTLSQENEKADTKIKVLYTVKEQDGEIVVLKNGKLQSIFEKAIPVNRLPMEDQRILKKGITFSSYKEFIRFIENYE